MRVESESESETYGFGRLTTLLLDWCDLGKKCCILPRTENGEERVLFRQRKLKG